MLVARYHSPHLCKTHAFYTCMITWRARKTHLLTINTTNFKFEAVQEFSCTQNGEEVTITSNTTHHHIKFHTRYNSLSCKYLISTQKNKSNHNKFLQETNHFLFVSRFIWWPHQNTFLTNTLQKYNRIHTHLSTKPLHLACIKHILVCTTKKR